MSRSHYPLRELGSRLKALPQELPTPGRILVVDEEGDHYRQAFAESLSHCDFIDEPCPDKARQLFLATPFDLVILSHSERIDCLEWLPLFKSLRPSVSVIVTTACGCEELAVQAFRLGAIDYFRKHLDMPALELSIRAVLDYSRKRITSEPQQASLGLMLALRFIETNLHTPICLARAALEAGMSISCFERHLKQLTGSTFVAHVNGLRVNKASEMLRSNRTTILQVALACGFSNQSHFNRVFRKVTGVTPGEYRKSALSPPRNA